MQQYKLGEICTIIKGTTGIKKAIPGEYPLVVTAENRLSSNEFQFDAKAVCIPLVSSTGHGHASLKRLHYQEGKFALGNILAAVIPNDENLLNAEYLYYYLTFYKDSKIVPLMKGAANVSLTINSIKTITIEIPKIEQQVKVVNTIKKSQIELKKINPKYQEQNNYITDLRTSILQYAVQGKLVEQNPQDEPASELLKRIKAEKEQLIKEGKIKKEKTLPPITQDEIPYDLPQGWQWVRMQEVYDVRDGTHDSPKNVTIGIPLITSKDFKNGKINFDNAKLISADDHKKIEQRSHVDDGDILYSMIGGNIGNMVIVKKERDFSIKNVALFKYYDKKLSEPYFLKLLLEAITFDFKNKAFGGAQQFVSLNFIRNYLIPLPPLAEQKRIVAKVEELLNLVNKLEEKEV